MQLKDPFPQMSHVTRQAPAGSDAERSLNPFTGDPEFRGPARIRIDDIMESGDQGLKFINTTGSLKDVCGFSSQRKRIGAIAPSKTISEAIVAIPIKTNGKKISIPSTAFSTQLQNLETKGIAVEKDQLGSPVEIKETSITDMIKKMKKFVIPPHLDFLHNKTVRDKDGPFVMYIFDFQHELSKEDLSMIWQNMMPDISVTAERTEAVIQHPVLTGPNLEFFGTDTGVVSGKDKVQTSDISVFPPNLRWMVFKVKQRAKNNYSGMSVTQDAEKGFGFNELDPKGDLGQSGKHLTYSYNWPYDFFSLVELAQIEPEISFEPRSSPFGVAEEPPLEDRVQSEEANKRNTSEHGQSSDGVDTIELSGEDLKNPFQH